MFQLIYLRVSLYNCFVKYIDNIIPNMPRPMSPTPKDIEVRIWGEGIGVKSIKGEPNKSAIPAKIKLPEDTYEANKMLTIAK